MEARIRNPAMTIPNAGQPLMALGQVIKASAPEKLLGLLHIRVSQINGCAACLNLHVLMKDIDETPERLFTLPAWRESPFFTPAERAALALAEQVTRIEGGVSDEVWAEAARHYDERTLAGIVLHVSVVNLYNRLNVATRQVAGQEEWLKGRLK